MKILIADDDPLSCELLRTMLTEWGYDVEVARDGSEAWLALEPHDGPPLAILDWMMPGIDGMEVCRRVRQRVDAPYVYILMLTAKDGKTNITEAIEAGMDDYITKPFKEHELKARLQAGQRIVDLQESLLNVQDKLRIQATRDPLTGLWNRAEILVRLDQELARSQRRGTSVSVVMADIDHFKYVNDTYGHLVGDQVLHETAQRIQSAVRDYDSIGRYGGEEFLMVLPACGAPAALTMAERIRKCVADNPFRTSDAEVSITLSLGVTTSAEGRGGDANSLIRAADAALYEAKKRGRNSVHLASRIPLLWDASPASKTSFQESSSEAPERNPN